MNKYKVVIDTNVVLSGLKSKNGNSYKLLKLIPEEKFVVCVSVPLILEYESVLLKSLNILGLTKEDITKFIDYICSISEHSKVYYLWRPKLKDPYDDHILELAIASNADFIITFNKKDFQILNEFGVKILNPKEFIEKIKGG